MKNNNFEWTKELTKQFLDNKDYLKLNIQDKHSETGFMYACIHHPELAEMMLKREDIDFNIQDHFGRTGFMMACIHQPELAEIMLEKDNININFNLQDKMGYTGFMLACIKQSILLDKMLNNDNQIDKTLKNKDGLTGYDLAKEENPKSFEIYQSWLEQNNINTQVQKRMKKPSQHL